MVAPAACSLRVPVRTHAGPGAHPQPCLWIPDKAQRTDSQVDTMDRGVLPLAIILLLATYSFLPTSKCPAALAGDITQTRLWVFQFFLLCPELITGEATPNVIGGRNGITNYFSLVGLKDFTGCQTWAVSLGAKGE